MRAAIAACAAVLSLAGCGAESSDGQSDFDPMTCERGIEGNVRCLAQAFDASQCDDARVLGAMREQRRGSEMHYTAYAVSAECLARLEATARERGFAVEEDAMVARLGDGYSERLTMAENPASDGGEVIWERIQE